THARYVVRAPPFVQLVEKAPWLGPRFGRDHCTDDGPRSHGVGKCREARAAEHLADVVNDEGVPKVRLVGPVACQRVVEPDPRKRRRRHGAAGGELLEYTVEDRLDRREDVLLGDERHLEVELIELTGGAVRAAVLVTKTRRDLKIPIEPGGHEELFELLRSLRQRVELSGVDTARHEVIPRAFRR